MKKKEGNFKKTIKNAENSMLSKAREAREHTYSEMADFFREVIKK